MVGADCRAEMLTELSIKDFAIIDELKISFRGGLNMLSGETGAGKSIIIGAVNLLLGDRASSDLVRSAADSAVVEALFDIVGNQKIREKLEEAGIDAGDELLLKRVVSKEGRNKIYINGSSATLGMLASLGELLVNICGQREHQVVLNSDNHIDILDTFGGLMTLRDKFRGLYSGWQTLKRELADLEARNADKLQREEVLKFQFDEIERNDLKIDEDLSLHDEKRILGNAQKLSEYANRAHEKLYASDGSILEGINGILDDIREIRNIDPAIGISQEELESIFFNLEELSFVLRDYVKNIISDPARLEAIDERLETLARLKRKYGVTIGDILVRKEDIAEELAGIAYLGEEINRVSSDIERIESELLEIAGKLSVKRRDAAERLELAVEAEVRSMRMADTRFEARFYPQAGDGDIPVMNPKGIDELEFYLSTNVGEAMMPLNRVASGGELSRIILAIKKVMAGTGEVGTVIFDEVDSGIGGAVAEVVGEKLQEVSMHHQVICITHLPQIACFGDTHFLVSKNVKDDRTKASVTLLSEADRLDEITRMLSGVQITEKTMQLASEMLKMSRR